MVLDLDHNIEMIVWLFHCLFVWRFTKTTLQPYNDYLLSCTKQGCWSWTKTTSNFIYRMLRRSSFDAFSHKEIQPLVEDWRNNVVDQSKFFKQVLQSSVNEVHRSTAVADFCEYSVDRMWKNSTLILVGLSGGDGNSADHRGQSECTNINSWCSQKEIGITGSSRTASSGGRSDRCVSARQAL